MDPRVPDSLEALGFELTSERPLDEVQWMVNGSTVHQGGPEAIHYLWPLSAGRHRVKARIRPKGSRRYVEVAEVGFLVRSN
jgi:hypothetical protein